MVENVGGMTVFLTMIAMLFLEPHDLEYGVPFTVCGQTLLLFLQLNIIVSDADALKKTFENKGVGGRLICLCCQNVSQALLVLYLVCTN